MIKGNYRLTVHVENQPKVDTRPPVTMSKKKGKQKNAVEQAQEQAAKDREFEVGAGLRDKVSNKGRYKVYTTLSFYCNTKQECIQKLAEVRSEHTIATGKDYKKKKKFDKELYNISWVN
jgi:hypothetical protein